MRANILSIVTVLATWILIPVAGPVIWECPKDVFQGIILGIIITAVLLGGEMIDRAYSCDEYDEWGDYKGKS